MLSLLNKKFRKLVAVDISPTSVRLLELSQHGDTFHVDAYGTAPIHPNAILETDIKDIPSVGKAIELAVQASGTRCRHAVIAVPSSSVISQIIQEEARLDESELEAQINLDASRYIPYPMNEVSLDFQVLGVNEKNPEKIDVFIAASRTQHVNSRVEALAIGHLVTSIVDVETYAIERACQLMTDQLPAAGINKTIAIIDIGSVITRITVLHNLSTIYAREEVFGNPELTEVIERRYRLNTDDSLRYKAQHKFWDSDGPEALEPFGEALIPLIRRSLQFFFSTSHYNQVDHIVLAGSGAFIPGLIELIMERLGTSSTIADPFTTMTCSPNVNRSVLAADAPALLVCCGLALRNFLT